MANFMFVNLGRHHYLYKQLAESGIGVKGIHIAENNINAASCILNTRGDNIKIPRSTENGFTEALVSACRDKKIDYLIPFFDNDLTVLARDKQKFEAVGTRVIISPYETIVTCKDKYRFFLKMSESGISTMPTFLDGSITEFFAYPFFVKPRHGYASIGAARVDREEDLRYYFSKGDYVAQPYIGGREFGVDILAKNGELYDIFMKEKITMRAGTTDKAVTFWSDGIFKLIKRLVETFDFDGPLDIDVLEKEGTYYIEEVNPRFGGGYPCAILFGKNFFYRYLMDVKNPNFRDYNLGVKTVRYEETVTADGILKKIKPKTETLFPRLAWNNGDIKVEPLNVGERAGLSMKSVKGKLAAREYSFEECHCFCSPDKNDILLSEVDRYGFYYPMVICARCGLMRANPRMTQDSYIDFYRYEYKTLYESKKKNLEELYGHRLNQIRERHRLITNNISVPEKAVIFDIGCDFGTALVPFAEKGCEVYGCDYAIERVEFGRKATSIKNLFIGGIETLFDVGKKADLVMIHHVLEHLLDLEGSLREARRLLKDDGILYISVPGIYARLTNTFLGANNILYLLQNAHTYQFSLETLRFVVECSGFRLIKGNEEIVSFFRPSTAPRDKGGYPEHASRDILRHMQKAEKKYLVKQAVKRLLGKRG